MGNAPSKSCFMYELPMLCPCGREVHLLAQLTLPEPLSRFSFIFFWAQAILVEA